ncbi:hypothetical protein D3C75_1069140 [compost metagenome]
MLEYLDQRADKRHALFERGGFYYWHACQHIHRHFHAAGNGIQLRSNGLPGFLILPVGAGLGQFGELAVAKKHDHAADGDNQQGKQRGNLDM